MSSAFLPSDRWGRNLTSYTSDTKKRENATSFLSLSALGCVAVIVVAVATSYVFPTVGEPLISSAGHLFEEMQGLREENALLKAHLRRLTQAQERLMEGEEERVGNSNQTRRDELSSMRRLLSDTASLLIEEEEEEQEAAHEMPPAPVQATVLPPSLPPATAGFPVGGILPSTPVKGVATPASANSEIAAMLQAKSQPAPSGVEPASEPKITILEALQQIPVVGSVVTVGAGMAEGVSEITVRAARRLLWADGEEDRMPGRYYARHKTPKKHFVRGAATGWRKSFRKESRKIAKQAKVRHRGYRQRQGSFYHKPKRL